MCGTNLETSHVVLLSTALSFLATVRVVEIDALKGCKFLFLNPPKRASLCGFTTPVSHTHNIVCAYRAVKALQVAGLGLLTSREMTEQELEFENFAPFLFVPLSPARGAAIPSS